MHPNRGRLLVDSWRASAHAMRTSQGCQGVLLERNGFAARALTSREAVQASPGMGMDSRKRSPSKAKTSRYGGAAGGLHEPEKVLCQPQSPCDTLTRRPLCGRLRMLLRTGRWHAFATSAPTPSCGAQHRGPSCRAGAIWPEPNRPLQTFANLLFPFSDDAMPLAARSAYPSTAAASRAETLARTTPTR